MPTRRARIRRRIYARLPKWIKRHDFEIFAAVLSIFAGVPMLLGEVRAGSVYELLPPILVTTWAFILVLGGTLILVGVVLASRRVYPEKIFWMRMEALGLTALAYFCYLYCLTILLVALGDGWSAAMLILAFGGTSHVREVAIQIELEEYRRTLGLGERA